MFNFKNKKIATEIIDLCELHYKFPKNKNMIFMYPLMKMIKTILTTKKKYKKEISKKIAYFFEYEMENENSLFQNSNKNTLTKIFDDIDSCKGWEEFINLFNKNYNKKEIEEWIIKKYRY